MPDQTDPAPEATEQQTDAEPQVDTAQTDQQQPDEEPFDAPRALEKIRKANSEAKALRERAKAAEDATATAEQKAKDLEAQAARVSDLEAQLTRERVARKLGLPDALVDRLRGTTEVEVLADAESLVALVAPKSKPARPVESLQTGTGVPAPNTPPQLTRSDLAGMAPAQIEQARAAGQLADLMAGKTT